MKYVLNKIKSSCCFFFFFNFFVGRVFLYFSIISLLVSILISVIVQKQKIMTNQIKEIYFREKRIDSANSDVGYNLNIFGCKLDLINRATGKLTFLILIFFLFSNVL